MAEKILAPTIAGCECIVTYVNVQIERQKLEDYERYANSIRECLQKVMGDGVANS